MRVRVLIEMDDSASGIRAVNALDSAMRAHNEKLRRADPSAEIDFEVLGVVRDAEEPGWEYGIRLYPRHIVTGTAMPAFPTTPHRTLEGAIEMARLNPGYSATFHRRRKAGPWVLVQQEGTEQ